MNKLFNTFLVLLCICLTTIAIAGPSILQIYMGGTGASTGAQALINLIAGSPSTSQVLTWNGSAWVPQSGSGGSNTGVANPITAPTLTTTGSAGSTAYSYCVVANLSGNTTCSPAARIATGNATLTSSNYINLSWTAVPSASSYDVYRVISGGTPATVGKLTTGDCPAVASTSCHDKGETANGSIAPNVSTSGQTVAASFATAGGYGTADPRLQVYLKDEFCGKNGDLDWVATGTITVTQPAGSNVNQPCTFELNANGTTGTISLTGTFYLNGSLPLVTRAYMRLVSGNNATNATNQQFGLVDGRGLNNPTGANMIAFMGSSRTGTATNFGCVTGGSGFGYSFFDSGIAQDTSYHWFEIDVAPLTATGNGSPSGSVVTFKIDHSTVCTSSGVNIYVGNAFTPFFGVANNGAVNGDMQIDYFDATEAVARP
ncbi:MAG: hypothetical protein JWN74_2288 [Acidobacteriaceae bacterium]|nr:hypothetical protein [Acidobacteriaceae bacterium]